MDAAGLTVVRRIAVGGTAEILLARRGNDPPVVQKRLLPGASEDLARRLEREGELLDRIRSPFVVRVLGRGTRYLLLEHVDGFDLAALMSHLSRRGTTLDPSAALYVIDGVCRGLAAVHTLGFVHADVSPGNVLLGRDGTVKIGDLGIARPLDAEPPSEAEGTLVYQAPEQLRLERIDPRADLFAIGLIAYELITGVPARPAGMLGALELLEARSRRPLAPSEVRPAAPAELDQVLLAALAPDRSERPPTLEAWRERLLSGSLRPDRAALARAVRLASGPAIPIAATAAAGPEAADTVILPRSSVPAERPLRTPSVAIVALALVLLALVGAGTWLRSRSSKSAITTLALYPEPVAQEVPPPGSSAGTSTSVGTAPKAALADSPAPMPTPPTAPRTKERGAPRVAVSRTAAPIRVAIQSVGASRVEVRGAGMDGSAPQVSHALEEGGSMIQLVAGPDALRIALRVARSGTLLSITIGAPAGSYYTVECDGFGRKATPVLALPLRDRLRCKVERADGARAAFELRLAR